MNRYLNTYGRQYIDSDDIAAVEEILLGDFLTGGPTVEKLEANLSEVIGVHSVSLCNSGTSALHLAMLALGIDHTWTVFVPAISFVATANAARMCCASIEFVDVDPNTGLMTPELLQQSLDSWHAHDNNTGPIAVTPVHLAGQTADLLNIYSIAKKYSASVVIDACHAFGTNYRDKDINYVVGDCSFADAEVFSFHPVKNIAMGEGGAVTTNDPSLANKVKALRSHGITRDESMFQNDLGIADSGPWYYEMQSLGFNYRLSDIQAALGLSQLKKVDTFKVKRAQLVERYCSLLKEHNSSIINPISLVSNCFPMWHLMIVLIDFAKSRVSKSELVKSLKDRGIGSQVHYIPIYRHPYYQDLIGPICLSGAESYYSKALSLPLHPNMSVDDVNEVVRILFEELEQ